MIPVPLIGGSYEARSVIANKQRCINYFPEPNRRDSPFPMTMYQRPGLNPLLSPGSPARNRGLYLATNGAGYTVIGNTLYYITPSWALTTLGTITNGINTPVSMIDNGITLVLVDGSTSQWQVDLTTNSFSTLVDSTGNFVGGTRVDTLDTFIFWNRLSTNQYGATFSNSVTTDILSRGSKATYPDPIATLIARRTEMIILGQLKGEIHYNVGGALFPLARLPGAYIEYGCSSPYSVAAQGLNVYWLSKSLEGVGQIIKLNGYDAKPITSFALANALQKMPAGSLNDAVGYCYQQNGHSFYVLSFPTGDQTWVYDEMIGDPELAWHQRAWTDINGMLHRERANSFAVINGTPVVGDWENGTIYKLDAEYYLDSVAGTDYDISFIRGFPQITQAYDPKKQMQLDKVAGKSVTFKSFQADMDVGNASLVGGTVEGKVGLRWSDDRGMTWGQTVMMGNGTPGQYFTVDKWDALGAGISKERVFEISHSLHGKAPISGAYIDAYINAI